MLTISKPLSSGQAHSYHEQEFSNARQNYYSEKNAVRGEWQGKLAAEWGLTGAVASEQFYRLAEGQHPLTGAQLVQHRLASTYVNSKGETVTSAEHRAGWDATFSAPKSVSITALVGGDEEVRKAHRESVRAALHELERYVQARIGGNHPAETTGKMAAATFEHDSARPVNGYAAPQLHTHAVIFNVTETEDGRSHSLQPRELYKAQQYATAVYRSELASRLHRLGYELERGNAGEFEIKGYSAEYLKASSPRRQQIKQYLESTGLAGAEAAEIGAHRTRGKKIQLTSEEMKALNLALARQHGNSPEKVVAEAHARARELSLDESQTDPARCAKAAREALTFARDRNMEREAVVDERLLMRDALRRSLGEARVEDLRSNLESRIASGEFVEIHRSGSNQPGRILTTRQMLALERENIGMMQQGKGLGRSLASQGAARSIQKELQHLSDSQRQAIAQILESQDRIVGLQGVAGGGKTTVLRSIRQAAERDEYKVEGFAPTSRAARLLHDAGIESTTLQRFLTKRRAENSEVSRLYVLDESSLASTKQVNQFLKRLEGRDRVLLVGDIHQHQAVEAGLPFEQLQRAGMATARLQQIVRQKDADLRQAVELISKGEVSEAVERLKSQGRIHEVRNADAAYSEVAREYLKAPESSLVISPDNRSRSEINRLVHESLQAEGEVGQDEHAVAVLANRHDLTGADRQWAGNYEPGDVIRFTRGSRHVEIGSGEYATVVRADARANSLTVRRENGQEAVYDPRRLQGVNVYRPEERYLSAGDRIQFTAPFKQENIANRELAHIEQADSHGNVRLRLESGRKVEFNLREHPHLDYGYAMTSYSSQGQTADRVIVHIPGNQNDNAELINRRFAYVALSRARLDAQVYTSDASELSKRLSREVSKQAAVEMERPGHEFSPVPAQTKQKPHLEQTIA